MGERGCVATETVWSDGIAGRAPLPPYQPWTQRAHRNAQRRTALPPIRAA
jgi:hypothetical protein